MKKSYLILLVLAIFILGCEKDAVTPTVSDGPSSPAEDANAEQTTAEQTEAPMPAADETGECAPSGKKCKDEFHAGYQYANCTWTQVMSCIDGCDEGNCLIDPERVDAEEQADEEEADAPATTVEPEPAEPNVEGVARITIKDLKFVPSLLTVKAGTIVVWNHKDQFKAIVFHQISGTKLGSSSIKFMSPPRMEYGDSYNFTFTVPGEYRYIDVIYKDTMEGKIIVTE